MAEELYIYVRIYQEKTDLVQLGAMGVRGSKEGADLFMSVVVDERDCGGCVRQNLTDQTSDELKIEHQGQ